jgi:cytochrome c553
MKRRWFYSALLSLCALGPRAGYAQPAEQAPDTMEARVLACAPCHGAKGEGTNNAYFPRLAGKPAGYLANQLFAFHTGRRHYPPMNYLLAYLPEDYLKKIADYFAAQRPPLPPPMVLRSATRSLRAASPSSRTATRPMTSPPVRAATARISRAWSRPFPRHDFS